MPAASDDLMHSFYPLLANAMIQADLDSVEDEGSAAVGEHSRLLSVFTSLQHLSGIDDEPGQRSSSGDCA